MIIQHAFSSIRDALEQYVRPALGRHTGDFDDVSIADEILKYDGRLGLVVTEDEDTGDVLTQSGEWESFWEVARRHEGDRYEWFFGKAEGK